MGAWGITIRQSDYGLDLLGIVVETQLKKVNFSTFNVAEAMDVLRQDILEDIKRTNRGCPSEKLDYYINANFPRDFAQAALLIAECLADYYRTGELIVTEYVGEKYDPVDHHIREFVVTPDDLKVLLDELESVQNPEHELYQSWFGEDTRQKWLAHIQSVRQTLSQYSISTQEKPSIRGKLQRQMELVKAPQKGNSNTQER